MTHSPKFRFEANRRSRLLLTAVCFTTLTAGSTVAFAGAPDCGCNDGCQRGHGPIYTALDTVAGGIEKLLFLGLKRRGGCDEMTCDVGCDAMPMSEMMMMSEAQGMPMNMTQPNMAPPVLMQPMMSHPTHSHPMHQQVEPSLPPAPTSRMMRPGHVQQAVPSTPMQMSKPRMIPMPANDRDATGSGIMPPARSNNDSMFDSLQDPFRDDSAQLNAPRSNQSTSSTTRAASYRSSSRRTNAAR